MPYSLEDAEIEFFETENTISGSMFGANSLINNRVESYTHLEQMHSDLSITTLRYPGGTVTEKYFRVDNYDGSSFDDIVENLPYLLEFDEFLDLAAVSNASVSLVIPTRYGLGEAVQDLSAYSAGAALLDDEYGNRVPRDQYISRVNDFVYDALVAAHERGVRVESIEIGNEYFNGSGAMTAGEYARLSVELSKTIDDAINTFGRDYHYQTSPSIIVQSVSSAGNHSPSVDTTVYVNNEDFSVSQTLPEMGSWRQVVMPGQGNAADQRETIISEFLNNPDAARVIDGVVEHIYEGGGFDLVDLAVPGHWQNDYVSFDDWSETWLDAYDIQLERHVSEWNAKAVGAMENRGLQHPSLLVELFFEMATHGVTHAQIWPMFSQSSDSTALINTLEGEYSFAAAGFELISESLIGTTPSFDMSVEGFVDIHGFTSDEREVLLISERSGEAQEIVVNQEQFFNDGLMFIVSTGLSDNDSGGDDPDAPIQISHDNGFMWDSSSQSSIRLQLASWGLARLEVTYVTSEADFVQGREGNDNIQGEGGNDTLFGASGSDTLRGNEGNDVLIGGIGDDKLVGGWGDDLIIGSVGNDSLYGNWGTDTLVGGLGQDSFVFESNQGTGSDYILDFQTDEDQLLVDGQLVRIDYDMAVGTSGFVVIALSEAHQVFVTLKDNEQIHNAGPFARASVSGQQIMEGSTQSPFESVISLDPDGTFESYYYAHNVSSDWQVGTGVYVSLEGFNRFTDVSVGSSAFDAVMLTDSNDAFFLHDSLSDFPDISLLSEGTFGDMGRPRIESVEYIAGLGGNDIIDLTSRDYDLSEQKIFIDGGTGNDTIWGSSADEFIFGGAGDDILFGGIGSDTLHGGDGADYFEFTVTSDSNLIGDFSIDEGDKLVFYNSSEYTFDARSISIEADVLHILYYNTSGDLAGEVSVELDDLDEMLSQSASNIFDQVEVWWGVSETLCMGFSPCG